MTHSDAGPGGVLELARSASPVARRRMAALAAVARPAGEVAALLLMEVLRSPRARAAALGLARSLARRLAGRRSLPPARAGVSVIAWRVTVVEECGAGAAGVLVRRVETALANRLEPPSPASWLAQEAEAFRQAQAALDRRELGAYQRAIDRLGELIRQAQQLTGAREAAAWPTTRYTQRHGPRLP